MADKNRGFGVPLTPWAFYIKLYCKRKGTSTTKCKSNLVEGMKSWLSLSETEKQQFESKFKEYEKKYTISLFRKAEPFMKMKEKRSSDLQQTVNETSQNQDLQIEMYSSTADLGHNKDIHTEEIEQSEETRQCEEIEPNEEINRSFSDQILNESKCEEIEQHPDNEVKDLPVNTRSTPEPLPLTIKTGKELFQLLNTASEETIWATLPPAEKSQYNRAVLLLKKDYLSKYRTYLESLTNKELYNCYNKTI